MKGITLITTLFHSPHMKAVYKLFIPGLCLLLTSCLTPEARRENRISQQLDLFYEYPEDIRTMIRGGRIDIGFDENMVYLALGNPHSLSQRKDTAGSSTIWQFFRNIRHTDYETMHVPVTHVDEHGDSHIHYELVTVDHSWYEKRLKMQIEFVDGKVVAMETIDGVY